MRCLKEVRGQLSRRIKTDRNRPDGAFFVLGYWLKLLRVQRRVPVSRKELKRGGKNLSVAHFMPVGDKSSLGLGVKISVARASFHFACYPTLCSGLEPNSAY